MNTAPISTIAAGALLAASAFLLSGCSVLGDVLSSGAEQRDDDGTITEGGTTDIFTIKVGDCLTDDGGDVVSDVPTVACDQPHAYEVYFESIVAEGDFPGEEAIIAQADADCESAFAAFVGLAYDQSALYYSYYYPTEESWNGAGDRIISCIIGDPDNTALTGTLAGAAR